MADEGQPWTATTWSLNSLREWGLDAAVLRERGTAELLAENSRWEYDDLPYWGGEVDCCINAWTLANGLWLGADVAGIVDWFVEHRLPDGGWNCEWVEGSTRSSFHSTLNSLQGPARPTRSRPAARRRRSGPPRRRGVPAASATCSAGCRPASRSAPWVDRFAYPFRWLYSVLNAADYFRRGRRCSTARAPDPRMAEAIELIRAARQPDGTWLQARPRPRPGVVRGRRAGGRAVEVADLLRHAGARLVGRRLSRLCRWRSPSRRPHRRASRHRRRS